MVKKIIRIPELKNLTGQSRSTTYLRIAQGVMTKPISLGGRNVGWPETEIAHLNDARIAGQSDDEIRKLVQNLHAARAMAAP